VSNNPNGPGFIIGSSGLIDQPDAAISGDDLGEWQALLTGIANPTANKSGMQTPPNPTPTAEPQPSSAISTLVAEAPYRDQGPNPENPGAASITVPMGVPAMIAGLGASSATQDGQALASALQEVVVGSGTGLLVDLFYDAAAQNAPQSFRDGVQTAAGVLASAIHDRISINIEVGYGEINGSALPNQNTSEGGLDYQGNLGFGIGEPYSNLRALLASHQTSSADTLSVNALPNLTSLNGVSNLVIGSAEAKALGVLPASNSAIDGIVGFGTGFTGSTLVGGALHEITHAMGRVPGNTGLSLFRYTAPGVHDFVGNVTPTAASYFSIDGGNTKLADFGIYSDPSDFLNAQNNSFLPAPYSNLTPTDPFDEIIAGASLTSTDLTMLDVLGFNVTTTFSQFASGGYTLSYFGTGAGGWSSYDQYPRALGDINGDGKADIVGFATNGVQVSLATGGGNFAAPTFALSYFGTSAGGWTSNDQYPRLLGDINGDGKADIVGFASNGVQVSLGTGGGNFAAPTFVLPDFGTLAGGWTTGNQYPRLLADVNGDGMADIAGFASDGVHVALATGGGNFNDIGLVLPDFGTNAGGWSTDDQYPRLVADVNGDGMADIVGFGSADIHIALATGGGHFASATLQPANFGPNAGGWSSQTLYPRLLGDVSGDRLADIVGFGSPGADVALAQHV
jgi:FG-GAP-like repeat